MPNNQNPQNQNQKPQTQPNQQVQGDSGKTGQNAPSRSQDVGSKNPQQGGRLADDDQRNSGRSSQADSNKNR